MQSIGDARRDGRNSGIDLFRGLLVLAVVLGHFSELTQRDSFLTWIGIGFRMPLFMGLTGYMFNLERARALPLIALLRKYHRRLILPWIVACIVHLTLVGQLDWLTPVRLLVRPPFHLWFVPVMMCFIVIAAVSRRSPAAMLAIALPVSIVAMYLFGVGHGGGPPGTLIPDRRFLIYPVYFFFGMWIARREPDPWRQRAAIVLAVISIFWWCRLYDAPALVGEVAAELISGLSLTSLLPRLRTLPFAIPPIAAVGRQSLFFYLWHPLAFGLWSGLGAAGLWMLGLSMLTLGLAGAIVARLPIAAKVLGVVPHRDRIRVPVTPGADGSLRGSIS